MIIIVPDTVDVIKLSDTDAIPKQQGVTIWDIRGACRDILCGRGVENQNGRPLRAWVKERFMQFAARR